MNNHSTVHYVMYNIEIFTVESFSTERRIDGNTYYTLRSVKDPNKVLNVNSKDCKPIATELVNELLAISVTQPIPANGKGLEFGTIKTDPNEITEQMIDEAIAKSKPYQTAQKWLRKQVAYGLRKYPEPLQETTWTFKESIEHALAENSDKQHYLSMMLEQAEHMYTAKEVVDMFEWCMSGERSMGESVKRIILQLKEKHNL